MNTQSSVYLCTHCGWQHDFNWCGRGFWDELDDAMARSGLSFVCPQCSHTNAWLWTNRKHTPDELPAARKTLADLTQRKNEVLM